MERLFVNLIENAMKYRGADAPLIRVAAERKDDIWEVSVIDNGIGIEPAFREKVFDVFTRLHGRDKYPGSGIGLASCRRIVERHGGRIWIEFDAGRRRDAALHAARRAGGGGGRSCVTH